MDLLPPEILQNIGLISVTVIAAAVIILTVVLVLTYLMFRNTKIIKSIHTTLLKINLLILDLLYMPAKKMTLMVGGNDMMIDVVATEIRNILLKNSFSQVPYSERIILLPQCLRGENCPAKFSSVEGARCQSCGQCKIKEIDKKEKELGYKGVYIAPGGGFVRRILKKTKPHAVVGVGCPVEVNMGLLEVASKGIPCQGVILLNSGCVTTDVDLNAVYEAMELIK